MTEKSVGRPSMMTPDTVQKLEEAFSVGATDVQACFIAGISRTTLHNYQVEHPEFIDRKEALKAMTSYQARKNISNAIIEGDKATSMWYLPRKDKEEFGDKVESTIKGDPEAPLEVNIASIPWGQLPQDKKLDLAKKLVFLLEDAADKEG